MQDKRVEIADRSAPAHYSRPRERSTRDRRHRGDLRVGRAFAFEKGSYKWFWLERNRWRTLLSVYPAPLLCLLPPALLAAELGLLAIAAREGWLSPKLGADAAAIRGLVVWNETTRLGRVA